MWAVISPRRIFTSLTRSLEDESCDICGDAERIVLTRHHYTREERIIRDRKRLTFPGSRPWDYRCSNCHMVFNKIGEEQFYREGGYQETHQGLRAQEDKKSPAKKVISPPRLVARYNRTTREVERFEEV